MGLTMPWLLGILAAVLIAGAWIKAGWRGGLKTVLVLLALAGGVSIALSPNWMLYLSITAITVSVCAIILQIWRESYRDMMEKRRIKAHRQNHKLSFEEKMAILDRRQAARRRPMTAGEASERMQGFRSRRGGGWR
ncbi:hypothetical protein ACFSM5_04600 [Lacibacterium aquatile]|uniref:Integral membrane protein n=1 Tax=Lacibacterium aquatile TaxID=1168082 RepID=A0ABW5DQK2_9PROT